MTVALAAVGFLVFPRVQGQRLADRSGVDVGAPSAPPDRGAGEPVVISRDVAPEYLWEADRPGTVLRGVGADATLTVALTSAGTLVAYDSVSGAHRWERRLPASGFGEVVVVDGYVLIETRPNGLLALDAADGAERWRDGEISQGLARPLVVGETVVRQMGSELRRTLELGSGLPAASADPGTAPSEGRPLEVTSSDGRLVIAPPGAARRVDVDVDGTIVGTAWIDARTVVVAVRDGRLLVVRAPDPSVWPERAATTRPS